MDAGEEREHGKGMLYERATRGDGPALTELIESYMPQLRGYVRVQIGEDLRPRLSADDVIQSVCVDLARNADALDFPDEKRFRAWLFKSALHKVAEKARFHRRAKRDVGREHAAADSEDDAALRRSCASVYSPSRQLMAREHFAMLEAALETLSEEHRQVIALTRIAELPHDVVAEQMNRSVSAVRKLLGRALLKLGDAMGEPRA